MSVEEAVWQALVRKEPLIHDDCAYVAAFMDVLKRMDDKDGKMLSVSVMCRVMEIKAYGRKGLEAPAVMEHPVLMVSPDVLCEGQTHTFPYTSLLEETTKNIISELGKVDRFSSDYYRKSFVYQMSRDVFHVLPMEIPGLYLPAVDVLVQHILHHLACTIAGDSFTSISVSEWDEAQVSTCVASLSQASSEMLATYSEYCSHRMVCFSLPSLLFLIPCHLPSSSL